MFSAYWIFMLFIAIAAIALATLLMKDNKPYLACVLILLGGALLLDVGFHASKEDVHNYKSICEEYAVAPELVEAVSGYTGKEDLLVAYYFAGIANSGNEIDIDEAIHLLDAELTDEEINTIIDFSDSKQQAAE